jgi:two-component sensor histidine kinase
VPSRRSFGIQVIERSVADQLDGDARIAWNFSGLECAFTIPREHILARRKVEAALQPA